MNPEHKILEKSEINKSTQLAIAPQNKSRDAFSSCKDKKKTDDSKLEPSKLIYQNQKTGAIKPEFPYKCEVRVQLNCASAVKEQQGALSKTPAAVAGGKMSAKTADKKNKEPEQSKQTCQNNKTGIITPELECKYDSNSVCASKVKKLQDELARKTPVAVAGGTMSAKTADNEKKYDPKSEQTERTYQTYETGAMKPEYVYKYAIQSVTAPEVKKLQDKLLRETPAVVAGGVISAETADNKKKYDPKSEKSERTYQTYETGAMKPEYVYKYAIRSVTAPEVKKLQDKLLRETPAVVAGGVISAETADNKKKYDPKSEKSERTYQTYETGAMKPEYVYKYAIRSVTAPEVKKLQDKLLRETPAAVAAGMISAETANKKKKDDPESEKSERTYQTNVMEAMKPEYVYKYAIRSVTAPEVKKLQDKLLRETPAAVAGGMISAETADKKKKDDPESEKSERTYQTNEMGAMKPEYVYKYAIRSVTAPEVKKPQDKLLRETPVAVAGVTMSAETANKKENDDPELEPSKQSYDDNKMGAIKPEFFYRYKIRSVSAPEVKKQQEELLGEKPVAVADGTMSADTADKEKKDEGQQDVLSRKTPGANELADADMSRILIPSYYKDHDKVPEPFLLEENHFHHLISAKANITPEPTAPIAYELQSVCAPADEPQQENLKMIHKAIKARQLKIKSDAEKHIRIRCVIPAYYKDFEKVPEPFLSEGDELEALQDEQQAHLLKDNLVQNSIGKEEKVVITYEVQSICAPNVDGLKTPEEVRPETWIGPTYYKCTIPAFDNAEKVPEPFLFINGPDYLEETQENEKTPQDPNNEPITFELQSVCGPDTNSAKPDEPLSEMLRKVRTRTESITKEDIKTYDYYTIQ